MAGDRKQVTIAAPGSADERRQGDRRVQTLRALVYGSFNPRRRGPRRNGDGAVSAVDWHHAQWLAIAVMILMLSLGDALLTLMLIDRGAYEANPMMAPLLGGSVATFAMVKIGITAGSVVLLTQIARLHAFGRVRVGFLLYAALSLYGALVAYEVHLLSES